MHRSLIGIKNNDNRMNNKQITVFLGAILLVGSLFAEVFPSKEGFDRYGGYLALKGTATGRFHVDTLDGRHFLITPDGHGFISIGVTHTGGMANPGDSGCDCFYEKFGRDWSKANADLVMNFQKWGYNSLGYGAHASTRKWLPYFASSHPSGKVSSWLGKRVEFPDVFSDAWKLEARNDLERTANISDDDPNLIGIYWTDLPLWDLKQAKRTIGRTWVDAIRELPEEAPGRIRYERFLRENGAAASDEGFLVLMAREVYSTLGSITRELAPNTLIFGERYAGWALPWSVIQEALPWIDVVSVQPYPATFSATDYERLYQETGKPIMICDHNISFNTPAHSNVMWETLSDVDRVGEAYARYLDEGFSTAYLIGYNKCQYIDRFASGKQELKQGLLQVDGSPYPQWVDWVRKINWHLHEQFLHHK